jgi:hypothetical protein
MVTHAYKHTRLMEASEARVEMAAAFDSPTDTLVASRILGHPQAYRRWEAEHDGLMRCVSGQTHVDSQVMALRSTALSLVHRKARFDYLRCRQITGRKRHRFFTVFYSSRDYLNAVLAEHGNYVRCSSSYLCTQYLAEQLMEDYALEEPLQVYEQWYAEYFRVYCDGALAETEEEKLAAAPMQELKPLLKHQLAEAREAILQMPQKPAKDWREVQIRNATGDTQKLRVLFAMPDRVN